jgi:hypothetical protein
VACFIISDIICNLPPFKKNSFTATFFCKLSRTVEFHCKSCRPLLILQRIWVREVFFLPAVFNPANPDSLGQYCVLYKYPGYLAVLSMVYRLSCSIIFWYPILSDSIIPLHPCYPAVSSTWYPCYKTILYYPLVSMLSGSIILWYPCCVAVLWPGIHAIHQFYPLISMLSVTIIPWCITRGTVSFSCPNTSEAS